MRLLIATIIVGLLPEAFCVAGLERLVTGPMFLQFLLVFVRFDGTASFRIQSLLQVAAAMALLASASVSASILSAPRELPQEAVLALALAGPKVILLVAYQRGHLRWRVEDEADANSVFLENSDEPQAIR